MNHSGINGLKRDGKKYFGGERRYNNCYTYAINQPINPFTHKPYESYDFCQPNNLGGEGFELISNSYGYTDWSKSDVVEVVNRDLSKIGYRFRKSNYKEYSPVKGAWKVAMCLNKIYGSENGDYHWYRQNSDGTWSHKKGMGSIESHDEDGHVIHNPKKCNRGKYTEFVGFFMIEPLTE